VAAPPAGVPLFLGLARPKGPDEAKKLAPPVPLTLWADFERRLEKPASGSYLAAAVRGFFDNGGRTCFVLPFGPGVPIRPEKLAGALDQLEGFGDADLIAAPDVMAPGESSNEDRLALQQQLLEHCDRVGARFAILDPLPGLRPEDAVAAVSRLRGTNGAVYYPRVRVPEGLVPPCGHVAGVYSRRAVHQAPANEPLEGVLDLEVNLNAAQQGPLNEAGVNCLRAFPGRGVVVWGARTLSRDPAWRYVNVRRLFLAVRRWAERHLAPATFEPNDPQLWARLDRELTGYLLGLFRDGALAGRTPQEAFYFKCDAQTNPPEVRDAGQVAAEVGLAASAPCEFIVVRVVQTEGAAFFMGPTGPA
jgi:Bacteriophage tail sheath protein